MRRQDGNALFLILIAVALFAALSYAITSSGRGGGNIDRETNKIAAAQILDSANALQRAVQKLQILNGCSDTQLSFENDTVAGYTNTGDPRGDETCHIFKSDGAGLAWPQIKGLDDTDITFSGRNFVSYLGLPNSGSGRCSSEVDKEPCAELIVFYRVGPNIDLCMELNDAVGVANPGGAPESNGGWPTVIKFVGAYDGTHFASRLNDSSAVDPANRNANLYSGCSLIHDSVTNDYNFYHVLKAR